MVIVDSVVVSKLDTEGFILFLKSLGHPQTGMQLLVKIVYPDDAELIRGWFKDSWLGATSVGELTIHAFL
ncbi:hypothetical protein [Paracoccus benzoatiresistens]|uniref:Uncharacterized protein n=1 Tax=Paracoccus benzoatiresistens TaxID=2997341 RepID=A0ABT4JBY5_9RHOB|nr:hypothetical protein [Paracoccus sp. EF6]MCZ0964604.1 hypothetical protein [Paracoccus sp. EF6]